MDEDDQLQDKADGAREEWLNDKRDEKSEKALKFVEHIENHLSEMGIKGKVHCKICGKDIDEITEVDDG